MSSFVRVRSVIPLQNYVVRVTFTNGTTRDIDLHPYLIGPVFEHVRTDPSMFRSVTADPRLGTLVWPNGADIDPDVLYHEGRNAD